MDEAVTKLGRWMIANQQDDETFAKLVGSDRTNVSRIRRGKQRPSWDLAAKIHEATKGAVGGDPRDFIEVSEAQSSGGEAA